MTKRKNSAYKYKYIFDSINNEIEAYTLGLYYSDGSVGIRHYKNSTQYSSCIHLQPSDVSPLYKINSYISDDTSVTCDNKVCFIRYYHKDMTYNLVKLGCKQNKTYEGLELASLDSKLYRHLIRGLFDGDGSLVVDRSAQKKRPKSKVWPKAYLACSDKSFLEKVQLILSENNIYSSINIDRRVGKRLITPSGYSSNCIDIYRLYIRKQADLKRLYNYLYDDSTIFIDRKKEKFEKYVNTEINIETKESISS